MSLITQAFVAEKYGLRLNTQQLSEVLGLARASVLNQISAGTFPIVTYKDGGQRWADYRDVAKHIDECRLLAA